MTIEVDEAVRVRCHARRPASAHLCIAPQQLALATGQDAGVTRSGLGCQRRQQWVRGGRARAAALHARCQLGPTGARHVHRKEGCPKGGKERNWCRRHETPTTSVSCSYAWIAQALFF